MGMTQEELVVRLGLDSTRLNSGLRESEAQVTKFQKQIKQSMTGLLKTNIMGLWMEVFGQFRDQWDNLTKWMADRLYSVTAEANRGGRLNAQADVWRQANKERWTAELAAAKEQNDLAKVRQAEAMLGREVELEGLSPEARARRALEFAEADLKLLRGKINLQGTALEMETASLAVAKQQLEISKLKRELTKSEEDSAKKKNDLAREEGKRAFDAYQDMRSAKSALDAALAESSQGASSGGSWQHVSGRSGWGSSRFVPNRSNQDLTTRADQMKKIEELKAVFERSTKVLEGFDERGIQIKAAE